MKYLGLLLLLSAMTVSISCGEEEERCFNCTLGATDVEVCTSNYQDLAARNNLDVNSLDEYLDAIRVTGFTCSQI